MSTLEALPLPGLKLEAGKRFTNLEQTAATEGLRGPVSVLFILRSSSLSPREVCGAAQRAGLAATQVISRARELLEALRSGAVDVIVAGQDSLPDMDRREMLDRARSAQPPVPVILVGESSSEEEALRMLREGATDYVPFPEMARLPSAIARALRTRQSAEEQAKTKRELDRASSMLRDNQKLIGVGRLAATIAHEINNPLESVTNLLYLLNEETSLSETARGYLAMAQRELDRVAQISRQTLKFARETPGPQRARIDELLEEVLALYSRRIAEKNLRIERRYDCREEALVFPGEMRQVLSNLVTNAIEASTMNGRLCLRVRGSRSWSDTGVRGIRIAVGDTGTGIPVEVQRRLGEPFFTTKGQRGTGLGLWVTRSIIERYGGEIQLRSSTRTDRHGTVFSIFLPTNLGPRAVDRRRDTDGNTGTRSKIVPLDSGNARSRASGDLMTRRASGN
jgi:two-component system, NtrC family, sensor kinase